MGRKEAYLYGAPGGPGATGGIEALHAFFLLLDRPEVYNLPMAPTLPLTRVRRGVTAGMLALGAIGILSAALFAGRKGGEGRIG